MGNTLLEEIKSIIYMKYTAILLTVFIICTVSCRGQNKFNSKLLGTWEETHREYVYQTKATEYAFTKAEANMYKGEKLVFSPDTLFAYVTYLTENTITPIVFEQRTIKTDTLETNQNYNINSLIAKKGKFIDEITLKIPKNNGYKDYYDEYIFYLFQDGSLGQYSDFSLHYFKKISDLPIGDWPVGEYGEKIISNSQFSQILLEVNPKFDFIVLTYSPNPSGESSLRLYKNDIQNTRPYPTIFESNEREFLTKIISLDDSWKKLLISVGDPLIDSKWEIRYKFLAKAGRVHVSKAFLYLSPQKVSNQYLIKGDEFEVLDEMGNFLKIRYFGKKVFEGWIKKSEVE